MVLSALLSSLATDVLPQVMLLDTAAVVWAVLERMYSSCSRARIMQVWRQLALVKKGNLSVSEFFNYVRNLTDTLAMVGKPLNEVEIVSYLLVGLDSDYDFFVTSITTKTEFVYVNDMLLTCKRLICR